MQNKSTKIIINGAQDSCLDTRIAVLEGKSFNQLYTKTPCLKQRLKAFA